mmetsp:Transcript_32795/g.88036  ORF Transcript_32795/g.88036 Transcript_32795/m.88036 type:complete len:484 (-) Transcript_32795:224-1675(-)|eukprot:CAMPEP_0194550044 /NCGR_PEP_ID=MMETSP0253-20130528/95512_1 /TAXON_ID=2966 /ORGANISM="Noctiluca scintillans" /LENGTH=483 /DNA_ID=CAMNT_0039397479 /DNA_START=47 /DNA_END=1498 /DNA_ORIENTATION=+
MDFIDGARTCESVVDIDEVVRCSSCVFGQSVSERYTKATDEQMADTLFFTDEILGSGGSADVRSATTCGGRRVAVKSLDKESLGESSRQQAKLELELHLTLDHPHIVRLEHVWETDSEVHMVLEELTGGELFDRLSHEDHFTNVAAADAMRQMLQAIAYLDTRKVAHRDLKPENVMFTRKGGDQLKLIDFGLACRYGATPLSPACGAGFYVPGSQSSNHTNRIDIWSAGVLAYMLLTGRPPLPASETSMSKVFEEGSLWETSRFLCLPPTAQAFLKSLLVLRAEDRVSPARALEHPWLTASSIVSVHSSLLHVLRRFAAKSQQDRAAKVRCVWDADADVEEATKNQFLLLGGARGVLSSDMFTDLLNLDTPGERSAALEVFEALGDESREISYSLFFAAVSSEGLCHDARESVNMFKQFDAGPAVNSICSRKVVKEVPCDPSTSPLSERLVSALSFGAVPLIVPLASSICRFSKRMYPTQSNF